MSKINKNLNSFFNNDDLTINTSYSGAVVKSLIRSILEPLTALNTKAYILAHILDIDEIDGLIKRLEYSSEILLREFSDFEFSKFDIEKIGFIVLNSQRYNCAFLYKEVQEDKYEIYLKLNSKLVFDVYETIKHSFHYECDELFYKYKPERRENELMNKAIVNLLNHFEEIIKENEYNSKIQENYRSVNETNTMIRAEMMQNVKAVAHEIKNQLSILDIYTRIFEKKSQDSEITKPLRKSIELIKSQIEQFKNFDAINLQERNIKEIIQNSISTYCPILKEKNNKLIFIDESAGIEARAFVDEEKFLVVVNNIIKNAHDATKNDEITIKLQQDDEKIKILFINHGEMIKKENQEKIFNSNFTTKKDGWGVGLAVCRKYVGSQFGTFELTKSDKEETIFTLTLPLIQT